VYDPLGRRVKILADRVFPGGPQSIAWDGTGSKGGAVPSGVYFVRLVSETGIATLKLTVLK
jgi:flagellar hook assembly protein FlgD